MDNHPVGIRVSENQQHGLIEMRNKVLSNVGAQDVEKSWYQVFDLMYFELL